jgi:hypothetical protein
MSRMPEHGWRDADRAYKKLGFKVDRETDDHRIYSKKGISRPLVLPKENPVPKFIISNNLRTGKINKKQYIKMVTKDRKTKDKP